MKTDATFVGANGVVVLNAVAGVYLNLSVVVDPCDAECENAVGDAESFYKVICFEFGVSVVLFFY